MCSEFPFNVAKDWLPSQNKPENTLCSSFRLRREKRSFKVLIVLYLRTHVVSVHTWKEREMKRAARVIL